MRENQIRKVADARGGGIPWSAVAGTVDAKTGVVDYRNMPGREYKAPANEVEEQVSADKIMDAASKRLRKRERNLRNQS